MFANSEKKLVIDKKGELFSKGAIYNKVGEAIASLNSQKKN